MNNSLTSASQPAPMEPMPVGILTGFLGSGKTSLLRRWLKDSPAGQSAVLINEFGEIGLDHLLLGAVHVDTNTVLLDNGCVCCSINSGLKDALLGLLARRRNNELPPFQRIIIETSGLAAPGPVLATLLSDAELRRCCRVAFVATVVDAVHAKQQSEQHPQWLAQVTAADSLWISKQDLTTGPQLQALQQQLAQINPLAGQTVLAPAVAEATAAGSAVGWLHGAEVSNEKYTMANWLGHAGKGFLSLGLGRLPPDSSGPSHLRPLAPNNVVSFCLVMQQTLDWIAFSLWLTLLLHRHGDQVLRIKALLNTATPGQTQNMLPTVLHGVGRLMHPPEHLPNWPSADHRSRVVFIVQGLSQEAVKASWLAFERFCSGAQATPTDGENQ